MLFDLYHLVEAAQMTDVLTLQEAAALLKCSADTVRRRAMAGDLPGRSGLGGWRFSRAALLNWLASGDDRETTAWRFTSEAKSGGFGSQSEISERCEKALGIANPRSARRKSGTTSGLPNSAPNPRQKGTPHLRAIDGMKQS